MKATLRIEKGDGIHWILAGLLLELPISPTDLVLPGIIYALGFAAKKLTLRFRPKSPV